MLNFCKLLTFFTVVMFGNFKIVICFAESEIEDDIIENHNCVCVPFWQCKEDYSGLIDDGIDVIDVRTAESSARDFSTPCKGFFDVCCQVQCGKRLNIVNEMPSDRMGRHYDMFGFRILGENNEAKFGEFPWMLGILENEKYRCGGSLIHPQVAISAAHCLSVPQSAYKIRAGEWNWETSNELLPHQDRRVKKVFIHPQYHASSLRNDIAIIILDSPFQMTENVGLTCLPFQGMQFDRKHCIVAGWGKNSFQKGTYQATLKKMELPIVPREYCLKSLQQARLGPLFNLHKSFICAGGEANKDTCKGDGGSPLVCPIVGQPQRYQQVGIVSWGLTCGVKNTPGVYVNVGMFIDWIDFVIGQFGFDATVYKYHR